MGVEIAVAAIGLVGSVLGGIGQGMMERERIKAEEEAAEKESERREARYKGVGDDPYWDINTTGGLDSEEQTTASDLTIQRARGQKDSEAPLGADTSPQKIGQQFAGASSPGFKPTMPGARGAAQKKRYSYDPGAGKIVYS